MRAAVPAGICTLLALGGHLAGGGVMPSVPLLLVTALLLTGVLAVLAGCQRGLPQLFGILVAGQLAFHAAFTLDDGHGQPALVDGGHSALSILTSPAMAAGHLFAAVLAAVLLAYGDHALWAAYRLLLRVALPDVPLAQLAGGVAPPCSRPAGDAVPVGFGIRIARATSRRGPPQVTAA
jgi:hypothetical protein